MSLRSAWHNRSFRKFVIVGLVLFLITTFGMRLLKSKPNQAPVSLPGDNNSTTVLKTEHSTDDANGVKTTSDVANNSKSSEQTAVSMPNSLETNQSNNNTLPDTGMGNSLISLLLICAVSYCLAYVLQNKILQY